MSFVLDTHTTLWYLQNSPRLSDTARITIEDAVRDAQDVRISAITLIEAVYLVEGERLPAAALERLREALSDQTVGISVAPIDRSIADALARIPRSIVPDMPDRIIGATALHYQASLISRDGRLRRAGLATIW